MALNLLVALLFGLLIGLDCRIVGRRGDLVFNIGAALGGFTLGFIWSHLPTRDWSFDSAWVEISAACCAFALNFAVPGEEPEPGEAADDDSADHVYFSRLSQSAALGLASFFCAWIFMVAFLALMTAGYVWRAAFPRRALAGDEDSSLAASTAAPGRARVEWRAGEPPRSFIAALNADYVRESALRAGSTSPESRQIRAVRNAAKPLDARSAANTRSTARANGTRGQRKIPIEARDPGLGRR